MTEPLVEAYNDDQNGQVVEVLAEAYLTNPINVAVPGGAGPEQRRQNRAIFELTLPEMLPGTKLVAIHDGAILGSSTGSAIQAVAPRARKLPP